MRDFFDSLLQQIGEVFEITDVQHRDLVLYYFDNDGDKCILRHGTVSDWLGFESPLQLVAEVRQTKKASDECGLNASHIPTAKRNVQHAVDDHEGDSSCGEVVAPKKVKRGDDASPAAAGKTPDVSISSLRNSAIAGSESAIHGLVALLRDKIERVRRTAVEAIAAAATAGHRCALNALGPIGKHDDEAVRRCAADALANAVAAKQDGAVQALIPLTTSSDETVRRTAADAICYSFDNRDDKNICAILEMLATHKDEHIRQVASCALCRSLCEQI